MDNLKLAKEAVQKEYNETLAKYEKLDDKIGYKAIKLSGKLQGLSYALGVLDAFDDTQR